MIKERHTDGPTAGAKSAAAAERRRRKAALLRENLTKRKAQQRERLTGERADGPAAPEPEE